MGLGSLRSFATKIIASKLLNSDHSGVSGEVFNQATFCVLPALIVHEGPSVFRIFHRWQAVNQKWKVLNYDKKRDSEDRKTSESEWTLSLLQQQEQAGAAISPSASSLMAAAATASPDTPNGTMSQNSMNNQAMTDHHCPYNFLHLLSHLRPLELRSQSSNTSNSSHQPRELVMRVTTV